jgi:hypothetical protein
MGLGQRARQKLKRRQRSRPLAGDAASVSFPGKGTTCDLLCRWADPSRGDLRRLRRAIADGWLDDANDDHRAAIVEIVGRVAARDSGRSSRDGKVSRRRMRGVPDKMFKGGTLSAKGVKAFASFNKVLEACGCEAGFDVIDRELLLAKTVKMMSRDRYRSLQRWAAIGRAIAARKE